MGERQTEALNLFKSVSLMTISCQNTTLMRSGWIFFALDNTTSDRWSRFWLLIEDLNQN